MHYEVTAVYQDAEIGYGEGESDSYAVQDCIDSIPAIYTDCARDDIRLIVRYSTGEIAYVDSLLGYQIATS